MKIVPFEVREGKIQIAVLLIGAKKLKRSMQRDWIKELKYTEKELHK